MTNSASQSLSLEDAFKIAVAHHRAGQLQDAEKYYRAILSSFPQHADANHNLGVMCRQVGKHAEALPFFEAALTANPANAQYSISYADGLLTTGNAARSIDVLKKAGTIGDPSIAVIAEEVLKKAWGMLGIATESEPPAAEIEKLISLFNLGRYAELEAGVQTMIAQFSRHGLLWKLYCASLHMQSKDVLPALEKASQLMPADAELLNNLGAAQAAKKNFEQAAISYRRALAVQPALLDAHNNLGIALRNLGDLDGAIASYRKALELKPDHADSHSNLGVALRDKGLFDDAVERFRIASELRPDNAKIHNNLAAALQNVGKLSESLASSKRVLELEPDNLDAHSRALFTYNFFADKSPAETLAEARSFGALVARQAKPFSSWTGTPDPDRPLRVGIVSGDLRDHPVGYFVEDVLKEISNNPATTLRIIGYSNHLIEDSITLNIKACCSEWYVVDDMSDEILAGKIRGDAIDILIDLSGHTAANRLPVFAWKPAPVQASWLGYFATTGLAEIDYLIADEHGVVDGEEEFYTEQIWRLPETRLCFTPPKENVAVAPLPATDVGFITFGCFNKLTKMTDAVVELWARILLAVPQSSLLLKATMLKSDSQKQLVIERFAVHGISGDRLQLQGPSPRAEYLAAYSQIDIALDPFPFTGGTTSVEALWMGVPVLTLRGDRFLSRQGVGILHNVGLHDWIADSKEDYVSKAISHSRDVVALARLRSALRQRLSDSPLCDALRFASHLETALRSMWRQRCAGK